MARMMRDDLRRLTRTLRESGLDSDADEVADLEVAVEALERPPGILTRMTRAARDKAAQQWRLVLDEWGESRDAFRLLSERVTEGRTLDPHETAAVRAQAVDLMKTLPAGMVVAAVSLVPIPGTTLLSPWMLRRLGLLPSRWREDAIVARLRAESERLREKGAVEGALQLIEVAAEIEHQMVEREDAARRCALRTHWDLDGDGRICDDERAAYEAEVERLAAVIPGVGPSRRWYLLLEDQVIGPARWSEFVIADADVPLLICLDGESGWVRLGDLRRRASESTPGQDESADGDV